MPAAQQGRLAQDWLIAEPKNQGENAMNNRAPCACYIWAAAVFCIIFLGETGSAVRAHEAHEHGATAASAPRMAKSHASRTQLASGVAFAPDGALWLVGLNAQNQLFVQHTPPGQSGPWSAPRVVSNAGDAVSANGEAFPKLAFGPKGWVVISYTQPLDKPYTGFVRMLRSNDGGQTFFSAVHSACRPANHHPQF
jgi:hypothetical protein